MTDLTRRSFLIATACAGAARGLLPLATGSARGGC
jgi:hypothetical protein